MTAKETNTDALRFAIDAAYVGGGYSLGWRFLYSPLTVLQGAEIAFIGLNPGGDEKPVDHAEFCMDWGSAYARERWKYRGRDCAPGQSPLQKQVLALFRHLRMRPEDVLAGNLVPFRSPRWASLADRTGALAFGRALWTDVLSDVNPKLVISMGDVSNRAVASMLAVEDFRSIPVNWHTSSGGNIEATKGRFSTGLFVGLPHLSTYKIINRPESAAALRELFEDHWTA